MSEQKPEFTKGPWSPELMSEAWGKQGAGWGIVARDPMRGRIDSQITGMTEANARLIAAAPDLLAACIQVRARMQDFRLTDDASRALDACSAAIAKARGAQ
jgi:hypothetical protein